MCFYFYFYGIDRYRWDQRISMTVVRRFVPCSTFVEVLSNFPIRVTATQRLRLLSKTMI